MTRHSSLSLVRRLFGEGLGTAFLVAVVIGSGVMGEQLADGNDAVALLGNTIATGAGLIALILIFGPVSGAHFNPVVSLSFALQRKLPWRECVAYIAIQIVGGIAGCDTGAYYVQPAADNGFNTYANRDWYLDK